MQDLNRVSGSSHTLASATPSVAKPNTPISPGTPMPWLSSPVITSTMTTVTPALTILLAAITREVSSGGLCTCKMA